MTLHWRIIGRLSTSFQRMRRKSIVHVRVLRKMCRVLIVQKHRVREFTTTVTLLGIGRDNILAMRLQMRNSKRSTTRKWLRLRLRLRARLRIPHRPITIIWMFASMLLLLELGPFLPRLFLLIRHLVPLDACLLREGARRFVIFTARSRSRRRNRTRTSRTSTLRIKPRLVFRNEVGTEEDE